MNPINRTELIGIFVSIAVMALALGVVRFKTDVFVQAVPVDSQGAVVVASVEDERTKDLQQSIEEAFSPNGELVNLVIDDVIVGSGPDVKEGDTLVVNYVGATQEGVRFDSSYERGEPFVFKVGAGRLIEGWERGVIGMKVGGQRILVIPSHMAYGDMEVGVIPPNSPLVFSVELLEIR